MLSFLGLRIGVLKGGLSRFPFRVFTDTCVFRLENIAGFLTWFQASLSLYMLQYTYGVSTKESYAHRAGSCPSNTRPADYKPSMKPVTEKITATTTGSLITTAGTVPPNVSICTKHYHVEKIP